MVGKWRFTEVISSGSGQFYSSFSTDYFLQFNANGSCTTWNGRSAGGSGNVSFESNDGTNIENANWYTEGKNVVFDVDVKGGISLKNYFGDKALAIFVKVPSLEVLEQRLNRRSTESPDSMSRRLFKAKFEMTFQDKFDKVLENEDLEKSLSEAQKLYDQFRNK